MKLDRFFIVLFTSILAVHIYAGQWGGAEAYYSEQLAVIAAITKPALLTSLMVWLYLVMQRFGKNGFSKWLFMGLLFSLIGDVLLMFQERDGLYFTLGLGSFLIAHVAYIAAFTRTNRNDHEVPLLRQQGWLLVLVVSYGVYFFSRLSPNLGSMVGPVMLYTVAIVVMLLLALNRYGKVCNSSFWYVSIGAAFFVISDSILAWNKFVFDLDWGHLLIMGTYGLAQLFITYGGIQQVKNPSC